MEKKLINKMIINCFKQYYEADSIPISMQDLEILAAQIAAVKEEDPEVDLYEIVNDIVYAFLTD